MQRRKSKNDIIVLVRNLHKNEKHFTASVWILTKTSPKKVLLIHHKKFNKWIQPGGHVEKFENPIETAIREVKEETGIDIGVLGNKIEFSTGKNKILPIPAFFIEQNIPKYGEEPEHFHLDMQYIVEVDEQKLKHAVKETRGIGWFSKEEALKLLIHENTRVVIQKLL